MLIAIPSKSRPFRSKSKELLSEGVLFVPENEEKDYRKIYNEVVPVPMSVKGITATRNWILRENLGEDVVFVDDDLKQCAYWTDKAGGGRKSLKMSELEVMSEFQKLFELTKSLGYYIWGVKTENSKISQHDEKPFLFQSYITASCMGIVNVGEIFFDEEFKVKEDYEIGLRHIQKYGGIVKAGHFCWENEHWGLNGGCGDYRTNKMEEECINKLIRKYPLFVKRVERKNSQYCIKLMFPESDTDKK